MDKKDKSYIINLLNDIIESFDYYSFLDNQEKEVFDILQETVKKIEVVKL